MRAKPVVMLCATAGFITRKQESKHIVPPMIISVCPILLHCSRRNEVDER